ncbi:MAG: response regulator transcription factor [Lachnospiraceae bacterium]|nr:response regulator transcription factor [Lachnospiraceae bacterium]
MDKIKILVADDESRMRKLVKDFFVKKDFEVVEAADGEMALDCFYEQKDIALLILDVMMPKVNGWEVCREVRQSSKVPIIMLTAKGGEDDELNGFDLGADEYITKPFSPKILVARAEALLRRSNILTEDAVILTSGGIELNKTGHNVKVDGKDIELSFKEFELLEYFMENEGIALSRERILDSVWDYDYFGDARTIDTHVKKLRSKIGEKGDYIKTVWGVGYKYSTGE